MMNCTLMSLVFSTFYNHSPFLLAPHQKQVSSKLTISNFYISRYFSNFYFSSSLNNQKIHTIFENSHFSYFLSRVIFVNQNNYGGNILTDVQFSQRQEFTKLNENDIDYEKILIDQSIIINKCNFQSIDSKTEDGGCIYTTSHLAIRESTFSSCMSKSGNIYCENSYLALLSTTFETCTAQSMSSCFFQLYNKTKQDIPTIVSFSSFTKSQSNNLFGVSYIKSVNPVSLTNSNITDCGALQCVGSFEVAQSAFFIRFTKFYGSYANVHNGCVVLRQAPRLLIESSAFIKCQHTTTLSETGCNLLIYNTPAESTIRNTAFIDSKYSYGYSITIVNGIEIFFDECIFSFSKSVEINPSSSYLCIFSKTAFECTGNENSRIEKVEEEIANASMSKQCNSIKSKIDKDIISSNIKNERIKKQLQNSKYNNEYLSILFTYDSKLDLTPPNTSSSFISNFVSNISEKNFCLRHGISKKHIIFFFIYLLFLIFGLLMTVVFEIVNRKYPSLCVIKPNKGGFMQAKTPHAIL